MEKVEKHIKYAILIQGALSQMFDQESESDYKIDVNDFNDEQNLTAFVHALANVVPCNLYTKLTGDEEIDILDFNHIANKLVFKYCKPEEK